MLQEGKGLIAPKPVEVHIVTADLLDLRRLAEMRARYRGYARRPDQWGQGLTNDPIFKGLVGERALTLWLNSRFKTNLDVDRRDLPHGDGGIDIWLFGISMQVKTRAYPGHLLICRERDGKIVEAPWKTCVSVTWDGREFANGAFPLLDGWIARTRALSSGQFKTARRGNHMNIEVPDQELECMNRLAGYLKASRGTKKRGY